MGRDLKLRYFASTTRLIESAMLRCVARRGSARLDLPRVERGFGRFLFEGGFRSASEGKG